MKLEASREDSRSTKDKIKSFMSEFGYITEKGYCLLDDKKLSDKEQDQIIGIIAALKGSKTILEKMLAKYSEAPKGTQKKVDAMEKAFIEGIAKSEDKEDGEA